ncbi:TonB-dependent siderophore receptor [Prolixibacter sp. NT017]|uniref:TonB-dependent receptor plug domain-containing protein n=1 Tax=Prolixibacter sp. NT017 TaxID=2652390 RepID=UPI001272856F|nr:TonB-dependent receptor [Prolixibacter sp. NT017]GET25638.1 TonB-dependent receptor [Prolixibacter sp. NT017]
MKGILLAAAVTLWVTAAEAQKQDSVKNYQLEQVIVNASRSQSKLGDIPRKIDVLTKNDLQASPADNVGDLLKNTVAVDIIEYPGIKASIGMRGFAPSTDNKYNVLLINGIPAGTENFGTLSTGYLQQVEIMKGPYSSLYGTNAMGGVINLVTPKSTGKLVGSVRGGFGSFNTSQLSGHIGGSLTKKLSFDLNLSGLGQNSDYKTGKNNLLHRSAIEKEILDPSTFDKKYSNTSYKKYNEGLRLGYQFSDKVEANYYQRLFAGRDVMTNGTIYGVYGNSKKDITRWSHGLNVAVNGNRHKLSVSPYFSREVNNYYNIAGTNDFVETENVYKEFGVMATDKWLLGKHNLVYGIDWNNKQYESKRWADVGERTAPYQPNYRNGALGVFAEGNLNFLQDKLQVSAGLRYDNINFHLFATPEMETDALSENHQVVNPHLAAQYKITSNWRVFTGYGTGFHSPDAFQKAGSYSYSSSYGKYNYKGNPNLKPEKSRSFDGGFAYANRDNGLSGSLTYFDTHHLDMIDYDRSNPDYTTFKNTSKEHMNGLEAGFAYDFGASSDYAWSLRVFANATYLLHAKSEDNDVKSNLKYVRKANANFGIEYRDFKHWQTRLSGRYIGHRYEDNWLYTYDYTTYEVIPYTTADGTAVRPSLINDSVLKHPQFLVFDWTGSYAFAENYTIGVTVSNLLDEIYTEKDGYPMPGRSVGGTFTWRF